MRVLVFGMSAEKIGGIESFLLNMNNHMDGDCVFDYVVVGEHCIYEDRVKQRGGVVYTTTPYSKNPFRHLKELKTIIKNCRETHKTAYFNLFSMVHMIPVMLCEKYGYKIVFHAHNSSFPKGGAKSVIYGALHAVCRKIWGGKKSITRLTCAQPAAEFMFGTGKNRSAHMIYNAVETDRFKFSAENRDQIRTSLGLADKKAVGFVGRLEKQKNPLFLIDIFEKIAVMDNSCRLLVMGDGSMRQAVEEAIARKSLQEKVIILPPKADIERYYSAMDIFLLPSLFEGLPVVLVEAQTNGLPSLVSAEAVPEAAAVKKEFMTFESLYSPAEKWAEKALEILKSKTDRGAWNEAVKGSHFDIDKEARRLNDYLS